jgi:DNA-binding beta-propeller fold protein YncE
MSFGSVSRWLFAVLLIDCGWGQTTSATFGDVVRLGGTPSDIVLDESRGRLYLINQNADRVDVYSYLEKRVVNTIATGSTPVAGAMSMDYDYLYVTNSGSSSLSVIDLRVGFTQQVISLSAVPEGVEVGADGRVLITTQGTSTTDQINSLLLFDPRQTQGAQVSPVPFPPPPATPSPLTPITIGRPTTTFRGKLIRTPDGRFVIGMSTVNNNAQTVVFVYETVSGSILRSRTVTGQSTVLSISPDGGTFMAGFTLYDTATLNVLAQYNTANIPFPLSSTPGATFNSTQNMGGSAFTADGTALYSAFNVAPATTPATRPQASTLLISNPRHLGVKMGIKIPESIIAKMVILSSGEEAWGLSESGLIHLPMAQLFEYPILMPETTTVFLAVDDCNRGLARAQLRVNNAGGGRLTFSVPDTTAALIAQTSTGLAPATIEFTLEPGRTNVTRISGTNLYSGGATNQGTALTINLQSPDAINVPNTIRVFMNVRQSDQRGVVYPVPTGLTVGEGLHDIVVDERRGRVYISNAGYNRIEVFDKAKQRFLTPIEVGQLPHQMALAGDQRHLYVANTGGESISVVDLDTGLVSGNLRFPARPRAGTTNPVSPQAMSPGLFGLQIGMSDGSLWKVVGQDVTTRPASNVVPAQVTVTGNNGPIRMMGTPGGESIVTMAGNGTLYRYDGIADAYTTSSRPYTTTNITGYYGAVAAGPEGSYYAANSFIFGPSLAPIGGSETPTSAQTLPLTTRRNVVAVGAIDENRFLRLTTAVRAQLTSTVTSDARPTLELLDLRDNSVTVVGAIAENPQQTLIGNTRINVPPRQIAMDRDGTAYLITLSGLTVVPLTPVGISRPVLTMPGPLVVSRGSFVRITGDNLADSVVAEDLPVPTVLGGSCVTFSNALLPILQTSSNEILAQVPDDLMPGNYVVVVRSLATGQRSDGMVVTVQ